MWDDFTIGEPDKNNMAVHLDGYNGLSHSLSHYWWHSNELRLSGRICKCSEAGIAIARMHADGVNQDLVDAFILREGLATMEPQKIVHFLATVRQAAFDDGRQDKALEICRCLGVECRPL